MPRKIKTRPATPTQCLNCGVTLDSKFCPQCGQKNKDYRLSFKDLFSDLIEEVLDVDSRLVQSIKYLFTKPGFLTKEYVKGRRVSYLPPLRLYLVASVLFFLAMSLKSMIPELQSNLLIQELSESGSIDSAFARLEESSLEKSSDDLGLIPLDSSGSNLQVHINSTDYGIEQGDILSTFRDNFAKMMFLLLPVAALLLKALYWRRQKLYVEHLIFSLHVHAFIFSILLLTVILDFKLVTWLGILWSLVYIYLAMKTYYEQSHVKTASKMGLLLMSYGLSLLLVMTLTLVGTTLGLVLEGSG